MENLRPCQDFAWCGGWSGFAAPAGFDMAGMGRAWGGHGVAV
ncbi:MAG: hypothetical protein V9G14_11925 [Cypionkella sp.]